MIKMKAMVISMSFINRLLPYTFVIPSSLPASLAESSGLRTYQVTIAAVTFHPEVKTFTQDSSYKKRKRPVNRH